MKKKIFSLLLGAMIAFSLVACGNAEDLPENNIPDEITDSNDTELEDIDKEVDDSSLENETSENEPEAEPEEQTLEGFYGPEVDLTASNTDEHFTSIVWVNSGNDVAFNYTLDPSVNLSEEQKKNFSLFHKNWYKI